MAYPFSPELLRKARAIQLAGETISALSQGIDVPDCGLSVHDPETHHLSMQSWSRPRCEAAGVALWAGWLAQKTCHSFPEAFLTDRRNETEHRVESVLRGLTRSAPELRSYSRQCLLAATKEGRLNAPFVELVTVLLLSQPRVHRHEVHQICRVGR